MLWMLGTACGDAHAPNTPDPVEQPPPTVVPLTPLRLATYDGSGQVVHPDVLSSPTAGFGLWMAITPYPFGDARRENPSIFRSGDGLEWWVPDGLVNPIASSEAGHLSDPDVVRDPASRELRVYFREVVNGSNVILLTRSEDGTRWSRPVEVARAPSHLLVSPAVVAGAPAAPWQMWSVNSGAAGCSARATTIERRASIDGITWGEPQPVRLAHPESVIWHLDVQWIPALNEYWALYNVYAPGSTCVTPRLHLATSRDGVKWRPYLTPVLERGALPAFRDVVYRSTFSYDPGSGLVRLWYSGATYEAFRYQWSAAVEVRPAKGLFRTLTSFAKAAAPPLPERDLPPPEPEDMPAGASHAPR